MLYFNGNQNGIANWIYAFECRPNPRAQKKIFVQKACYDKQNCSFYGLKIKKVSGLRPVSKICPPSNFVWLRDWKQETLILGTALGFNSLTLFRCLICLNERYSTFEKAVVGAGQGYYVP